MLIEQTTSKLQQLRCGAMARIVEKSASNPNLDAMSNIEFAGMMADAEYDERQNKRIARLEKSAGLKDTTACIEGIDVRASRGIDRQVLANLGTCEWIRSAQNVTVTGLTGTGKTHFACALGKQAVRNGLPVRYFRISRLLEEFSIAHADGTLLKLRAKLLKQSLLILDDWALTPMTERGRHDLLEIIDDRIGQGSVIIISQLPVAQWHDYIGEATIADAILDRLIHSSHHIELKGESMRKQLANKEVLV